PSAPDPQPPQFPLLPLVPLPMPVAPSKSCIWPTPGEVITSLRTQISYTIGEAIREGHFGIVYSCQGQWENDLAAKFLQPVGRTYEKVKAAAEAEFLKLLVLRHPNIT